jgi:signal transduction histidine kinase
MRSLLTPAAWLRLPPPTARLRLTLLYAGLFLLSGTCVLAVVYVLAAVSTPLRHHSSSSAVFVVPHPAVPGADTQVHDPVVAQRAADLGRLLAVSWLGLAVTSAAAALLGWIAAGRVLRPLRAITSQARTISAGSLHQRLALDGPNDEFKQLGDTLDDLLGRLEASFDAQRRFVANASHELRTPLTVERTLLQVALADRDASAADLRSTCEELLASGDEHERLLESLLTLATGESGLDHREPLDLSTLCDRALEARHPDVERLSLQIETTLSRASAIGDPALVERLIANLIDNAICHNIPGGWVRVRTETVVGTALLKVSNSGPQIAPDEVDRLFEAFHRRAQTRAAEPNGHHGLGLSIVRAIATAHHATVDADARPDGGLMVVVRFESPIP